VPYFSRAAWQGALLKSASQGRAHLASNAGEVQGSTQSRFNRLALVAAITAVHARGGKAVVAGIGIRAGSELPTGYRKLLEAHDLIAFRDHQSRRQLDTGEVRPDWAFSSENRVDEAHERRLIAVAMRSDRPVPGALWVQAVRETASNLGAEIVVTVQVRRDQARAGMLAQMLGAKVMEWPQAATNAEQEEALLDAYRSSIAVVSDRLHGLVLAATAGAAPLGFTTSTPEKLDRTFAGAMLPPVGISPNEDASVAAAAMMTRIDDFRVAGNLGLQRARASLSLLGAEIEELLS
jgi:hypothetical protein